MVPPKDKDAWPHDEELGAFRFEGAEPADVHAYVERYSQRFEAQIACVPVRQRSLEHARGETEIADGGTLDLDDRADSPEPEAPGGNVPAPGQRTLGGRTLRLEPSPPEGPRGAEAPDEPVIVPIDRTPRRWLAFGLASTAVALSIGIVVLIPSENGPPLAGPPAPIFTPTTAATPAAAPVQAHPAVSASVVPPHASASAVAPSAASFAPPVPPKRDGGVASPPSKPPTPLSTVGPLFDNDDE
jgi:hypothetical protein